MTYFTKTLDCPDIQVWKLTLYYCTFSRSTHVLLIVLSPIYKDKKNSEENNIFIDDMNLMTQNDDLQSIDYEFWERSWRGVHILHGRILICHRRVANHTKRVLPQNLAIS